jgi:hypothetical protein
LASTAFSAADAATLSVTNFGTVSGPSDTLFNGVTVVGADNAQTVRGGTTNNGTILTPSYTNANAQGSSGWNPYGSGGTWLSIGGSGGTDTAGNGSSITFSLNNTGLQFVWGSPSSTNKVTLLGDNGTTLGTVFWSGTSSISWTDSSGTRSISNANLANSSSAGALIGIVSDAIIKQAVFSTAAGSGGFEVAQVSAVPLPATLPLLGGALLGLGVLGRRRARAQKA